MATITTPPAGAPDAELSPSGVSEPSMEDILASIRRIIAEDQSNGAVRSGLGSFAKRATPPVPGPGEAMPEPAPAVEPAAEAAPAAAAPASDGPHPHADDLRPSFEPERPMAYVPETPPELVAIHPEPPAPAALVEDWMSDAPLISPAAGASVQSSFHALAESMVMQDPAMIERAVRDAIRPMLKEWLDDNLPSLVERLVRAEIERVARGGPSRD